MSHLRNFIITVMMVLVSATTVLGSVQFEPTKTEKYQIETGENHIVEIYEVEVEATSNDFVKEPFIDNGIKYVFSDIVETENIYVEEKEASVPKEQIFTTGNKDEIIANLEKEIPYEDEYGYVGNIKLDTESVIVNANETSTKTWNKTETKTYSDFMFKDNSVIPSTMTNSSGTKFKLQGVTWEVTQQELNGVGELVPTKYNAVATYSATVSSTTVDNYKAEFIYKGTVAKNLIEGKKVEVKYVSVPVENEVSDKESSFKIPVGLGRILLRLLGLLIFIAVLIGGAVFLLRYLKSLKGIEVYNYFDDGQGLHYVYLGKITVDIKTPVVDLNVFSEEIQSSNFNFVLDKNTTNSLFGKCIGVTLDGVTVMHEITTKGVEHTFKLTIGDSIDLINVSRAEKPKPKKQSERINFNEEDFYIEQDEE